MRGGSKQLGAGRDSRRLSIGITAPLILLCLAVAPSARAMESTLGVRASAGETAPPPEATALPECSEAATDAAALNAADDPAITKIAGGGKKYSFALPGGSDEYMTVNEPPAGFDPLTATDAELQLWGFPPRPANAEGLETWREMVGSYRRAPIQPGCQRQEERHTYYGEFLNFRWSGYENDDLFNPTKWHAVMGTFYQPYDHGGSCANSNVASWVGLGGSFSGRFMQTGTEVEKGNGYAAWIEIYAGNYNFEYYLPFFPIEGTNYIRLYAGYNRFIEVAYFYITNDHTGQTVLTEWHIGPQFYDGSSAEWIDEAAGDRPLLNFGQINWFTNQVQNGANEVLPIDAAESYEKDVVWKNGSHSTMWPGSLWNHENFTDFYYTCK